MSSSQDSDIDQVFQRVRRPKKFNAKLMGSIQSDAVSMQQKNQQEFFRVANFKNKKSQKFQDQNTEKQKNKYARRLPIAFKILNQGITSITSNVKPKNQNNSFLHEENSGSVAPSSEKSLMKLFNLKRFQQDCVRLGQNIQNSDKGIEKDKIKKFTKTYHHPQGNKFLNEQTLINDVRTQQKTLPVFNRSLRHRTQIIKQVFVGGNKIRTNWHKGLIDGYTEIDYEDKGKFRGIFQSGEMSSGQMTFSNGFIYTGEFSCQKFHGIGKLKFPSGQVFEGNWYFGSLNGKAKIFYPQGQFYYGQVKNFKRDGQGYLYFKNGDKYVGQFFEGQITGFGQLHKNGACAQKGYWLDGKFMGNQYQNYLRRKEESKNSQKKQKISQVTLDFQNSLKEIISINQMIKNNQGNQVFQFKSKLCVSFNECLNEEFVTDSKEQSQQQGWPKMQKQTSLGLLTV